MNTYFKIIYSPKSVDDLNEIYDYIEFELRSKQSAIKQVSSIRKAVRNLDFMPEKHPVVEWEPWSSMKIRKLPVNNYIIFYTVNNKNLAVTIVRILYEKRNIEKLISNNNF